MGILFTLYTLPETNIAHENAIFPGKYHEHGGFSMAMLVYRSVMEFMSFSSGENTTCRGPLKGCAFSGFFFGDGRFSGGFYGMKLRDIP